MITAAGAESAAAGDRRVRLVAEDVDSGERTVLTDAVPWRAIEVLGSAAHFYAAEYVNPDRVYDQVRRRRDWAGYFGAALWDLAEMKVGVQTPTTNDLPPPPPPPTPPTPPPPHVV